MRCLGSSRQGDPDAALADFGRVLRAGVPGGYSRLLLDEGPAMAELLRTAARNPDLPASDQAAGLLQADECLSAAPTRPRLPAPGSRNR